ncbi:MAG TPA: GNAT family N-acetyltransferase, partial [Thermomicrobiales bacterium]|nr:GNAT family N-acetyltransferase [Thermomicrobiales bacterium]
MGEVTFRRATEADIPAIVAMLADDPLGATRESPDDLEPYRAAFAAIDANTNQVLIAAERDGEVVGTGQLTMMPGLSHRGMWRAEIEAVRVRSDQRGSGLGTALIEWCI